MIEVALLHRGEAGGDLSIRPLRGGGSSATWCSIGARWVPYGTAGAVTHHIMGQSRADAEGVASHADQAVTNAELRTKGADRLLEEHSPDQIARRLRNVFPDRPEMWVSHETIAKPSTRLRAIEGSRDDGQTSLASGDDPAN